MLNNAAFPCACYVYYCPKFECVISSLLYGLNLAALVGCILIHYLFPEESILLDLKHLLIEAKQKVPPFLIEFVGDNEENLNIDGKYCHTFVISYCQHIVLDPLLASLDPLNACYIQLVDLYISHAIFKSSF